MVCDDNKRNRVVVKRERERLGYCGCLRVLACGALFF
jgi:hypothetical protein